MVLQARTTSRRLPAKVLLPLGGGATAILCAKRLGNTGCEVVLATSAEESDNTLARCAASAGIRVFRGSLNDVMSRFVDATSDLTDHDIVVRATADNPLPDGAFVDALVERFQQMDLDYVGTNSPSDGLPYGASAEVLSVGALRLRDRLSTSSHEREHVTPMLRTGERARLLRERDLVQGNYAHLRCTIDTLDDYLHMAAIFDGIADPVRVPWVELLEDLPANKLSGTEAERLTAIVPARGALCLGTAQLGIEYGIANSAGLPSERAARSIIELALAEGISIFDTARSYGAAECRLGSVLGESGAESGRVITKLSPLTALSEKSTGSVVINAIEASVFRSCHALRRRKLDVLMFHRSEDMTRWGGIAMAHVEKLTADGVVGAIGVSVYSPDEAVRCMEDVRITHLQIPFNLLDRRWTEDEFLSALKRRPDLSVHARSIFLQGLLVSDAEKWPQWVVARDDIVARIGELCDRMHCESRAALCIAYVRAFPWVSTLVVGVDSREQLEQLLLFSNRPALSEVEICQVHDALTDIPNKLLDPRLW